MVQIVEVGPRDGLQNEAIPISTDAKRAFIQALLDAGLKEIEATSFVSPKWVPQLADAAELWTSLPEGEVYSALVPNQRGLDSAIQVGCKRIALFTAASDAFTQKNINMSVAESLAIFEGLASQFRESGGEWVRGYVSTAYECPYAGVTSPSDVCNVVSKLVSMGVDEISIGDTIGVATPKEVKALHKALLDVVPVEKLAYHFHDTRGTAIANVAACLELGVRRFDSSSGGLGGCPYAKGAGGNLATDDLVYFLHREGFETGVNPEKLAKASLPILAELRRAAFSRAQQAVLAE